MEALMLSLQTEATTEEKTTLVLTNAITRTIEDHTLFKKIWIHASRHIIIKTDGEEGTGKSRIVTSAIYRSEL